MKKIISLFLALVLMLSVLSVNTFAWGENKDCNGECSYYPTIIIPGLGQSNVFVLDENGDYIVDKDGNKTGSFPGYFNIGSIIKKAVLPLLLTIVTQRDIGFSDTVAEILYDAFGVNACDNNAQTSNKVVTEKYLYSLADCNDAERAKVYHHVPLNKHESNYPEDHLYYFAYNSFGNHIDLANELYDFIQMVKEQTGHDKVNISPISQGGSIANALFEYHPEVMDDLHKVIFIVPALNGSTIIGDVFNDRIRFLDPAILYNGFLAPFFGKETASMIETLVRIIPDEILMTALEKGVKVLLEDVLTTSTSMWALCPAEDYPSAAAKYLSSPERASIKAQTDKYYQAQLNSDANIEKLIEKGVQVFNIAEYDVQMYSVGYSYDKENADGIIQLDSTSMGAYAANIGETLPDDYKQANTHCSNPEHNHISPDRVVDASAGLLPDTTFYFENQKHELSASNDYILKLALRLLEDDKIQDVYSNPEFKQFTTMPVPAEEETGFFTKASAWLYKNFGSNGFSEIPSVVIKNLFS